MKKEIKREKLFPTSHIIFNVHNWSLNARISMFKQTDFEEKNQNFVTLKIGKFAVILFILKKCE